MSELEKMNLVDSPKDMAERLTQLMMSHMSKDPLLETSQEQWAGQMTHIAINILAKNQRIAVEDIKEYYFKYCIMKRYRNRIESTTGDEDERKMAKDLTDFVEAELVNERWDVELMQGKMIKIAEIHQVVDLSFEGADTLLRGHGYDVAKAAAAHLQMLEDDTDIQPRKLVGRYTSQPTKSRRRKLVYNATAAGTNSDPKASGRTRRGRSTELSGAKVGEFTQNTKVVMFWEGKLHDGKIDSHVQSGIWVQFPNGEGMVVSLTDMRIAAAGSKDSRGCMQIYAPIPELASEQAGKSASDHTHGSNSGEHNRDCAGSTKMGDRGTSDSGIGGGVSKEVETMVEGDNDSSSSIGFGSRLPAAPACFGFQALKHDAEREVTNAALWKNCVTAFSRMYPTVVEFAQQAQFPPPTKPQLRWPYSSGFSQPENLDKQEFLMVHAASLKIRERMKVMRELREYTKNKKLVRKAMIQANKLVGFYEEDGSYMICAILLAIQEQAGGECGHYCFCVYFLTIILYPVYTKGCY